MKLREIVSWLDSEIPLALQEGYDNSGIQVGEPDLEINSALLAIDVTEAVADEALAKGCNLIIAHHPLIFGGIRKLTGSTPVEKIILKAVRNNIAIYAAHTNLDVFEGGVSVKMAEKLQLGNIEVLVPADNLLLKIVTFVPATHLEKVRNALFDSGAGVIGNYDRCGYALEGTGSFRGNEDTNPFLGEKGKESFEKEVRFETVIFRHNSSKAVRALLSAHPYDEPAFDLYPLANRNVRVGMGAIGILEEACEEKTFLNRVSDVFGSGGLRYSTHTGREIRKVAVCGGSGASFLKDAVAAGADAYVTADIKYHTYFEAENRILLVDAGHFETEKFSEEILHDLIIKKFPKFAVRFSETKTNPINYL